ncbi:MAG: hypothetical protein LBF40_06725 [Deltaproteobacteria bacterium]|jgi:DNA polymerase-3 subunit delta'|nr:hypothetical protein [Deltaproteobacteria bacterium]
MPWSLIGADRAKLTIGGMLLRDRFPHSLLITGAPGGGKRTMALDIAKALNCLNPGEGGAPCQECLACRKTGSLNHPDVAFLAPAGRAGNIPIKDIRELSDRLAFKPYEGRNKVAIISSANRLSNDSGWALLKTLEEPTPNTVIMLTAPSAGMIMPTLASRCVRLGLPPLPRGPLLAAIRGNRGYEGPEAELLAGLSCGALGKALGLDPAKATAMWEGIGEVFEAPTTPGRLIRAKEFTDRLIPMMGLSRKVADALESADGEDSPDDSDSSEDAEGAGESAAPAAPAPAKSGRGRKAAPKPKPVTPSAWQNETLDLFVAAVRLWFRDALLLKATGDPSLLEGPPPGAALRAYARALPPRAGGGFERAVFRLLDSLYRYLRPELAFGAFWLSVL